LDGGSGGVSGGDTETSGVGEGDGEGLGDDTVSFLLLEHAATVITITNDITIEITRNSECFN